MQRRTFSRMILILALSSLPAIAEEGNGWQFDSLGLNTTSPESDAQQVYDVLLKLLDRCNAHDIEGYLEVYWKSSELLVVIDSELTQGPTFANVFFDSQQDRLWHSSAYARLARFPRLRGERDPRPANFSKSAVIAKNILVPAQDGTHNERIIGVADLRNRIWYYVYFFGRITKGKRSFFS
jgi:hypothetical protein